MLSREVLASSGVRIAKLALVGFWVALVVGLVLYPGVLLYQKVERVRGHLASVRTHVALARAAMPTNPLALREPSTLAPLRTEIASACSDLTSLQGEMDVLHYVQPMLPLAGQEGARLAQVLPLLELGVTTCDIAETRFGDIQDLMQIVIEQRGQRLDGVGPVLLDVIGRLESLLPDYRTDLERVRTARASIDRGVLDGWIEPAAAPIDQLDRALERAAQVIDQVEPVLPPIRSILGADGPRTYIVLGQNSHELRATGGFTSGIGAIVIDHGRLVSSEFRYSYGWDSATATRVIPPEPYQRYLGIGTLFLRDANWWPDFPTTARQVQRLWALHQGGQVDGVLAIDEQAVQSLLKVTGPVDLPKWGLRVGADDFYEQTKERATTKEIKAQLLPELYRTVFQKLLTLTPERVPTLVQVLTSLAEEKHLQVYLADPVAQAMVVRYGADGALRSVGDSDYLFVVDTTVTYSEVNHLTEKTAALAIVISPDSAVVDRTLTLHYRNMYSNSLPIWEQREAGGDAWDEAKRQVTKVAPGYWGNWLRIYVPAGTVLVSAEGFDTQVRVENEGEKRVIGGFLGLAPGEERIVVLRYHGLEEVSPCPAAYPIFVQKQAGAQPHPMAIRISTLRPGCNRQANEQLRLDRDEDLHLPLRTETSSS